MNECMKLKLIYYTIGLSLKLTIK